MTQFEGLELLEMIRVFYQQQLLLEKNAAEAEQEIQFLEGLQKKLEGLPQLRALHDDLVRQINEGRQELLVFQAICLHRNMGEADTCPDCGLVRGEEERGFDDFWSRFTEYKIDKEDGLYGGGKDL